MVTYITRAQWGAAESRGAVALVSSAVKNTAFHWPGMKSPINAVGAAGLARVCAALRGWQRFHMQSRGWSDIAYQVAIDQEGRAYSLRGINVRSGANGDGTTNKTYGAILLILAPGEKPSAKMQATAKAVVADFKKRYPRSPVRPTWHGAVRPGGSENDPSTTCPGPLAIAAIKSGQFDAGTAPVKPPAVKPAVPKPVVDLSALVYHAKAGTGKYEGNTSTMVGGVKRRLIQLGCGSAGNSFRTCYRLWQLKCGYTGRDADGIPGLASLTKLAVKSGWRVVA